MLIKSYEISKKNLNSLNFFLIYGENIGLKQDIIKSVLERKEKKKEKYKQFEFEEEEIIKNQNNFFNLILEIYIKYLFLKQPLVLLVRSIHLFFGLHRCKNAFKTTIH